MAYTAPTVSDLMTRFPAFAAVDNAIVTNALAEAARMVDESWTEGDFALARMLYACHVMTMDGQGTGADAQVNAQGLAGFKSIRSGALSVERSGAGGDGAGVGSLDATTYGSRFKQLLRLNRGGLRVAALPVVC